MNLTAWEKKFLKSLIEHGGTAQLSDLYAGSGIPRTKTYEVAYNLEAKGLITVEGRKPKTVKLNRERMMQFLEEHRKELEERIREIDELRELLTKTEVNR